MESFSAQQQEPKYDILDDTEGESPKEYRRSRSLHIATHTGIFLAISVVLVLGLGARIYWFHSSSKGNSTLEGLCKDPPIRREWRSLTKDEKVDFTGAVNCLSTVPSRWAPNGTLYDDFTALHARIGSRSHRSAAFLPWHRYTLFIWETALRKHCGFKGHVPYWDWSLDWMDLANSTIWNNVTGFGGDGEVGGPIVVGNGRCVTDGPFAQLRPIRFNHEYVPHCLSRGFRDGDTLGQLRSEDFGPETIGRVKRSPTYQEFVQHIDLHLHNVLHQAVAGDFAAVTAANDPVFYVHHAQLDRLWWHWQQEDRSKRLWEYKGKHMADSTVEDASLDKLLLYGGFVDDIPVSHVMDTEKGLLCYRY